MNKELLEEIGLTKGEILVYQALLKLGQSTSGQIIKEAQISSGKIYEILEKLISKGLASYIIKEKTKYFQPAPPHRLLGYLREKESILKQKESQLKIELPKLTNLYKTNFPKHEATLYQGFKGFRTAIYEALEEITQKNEVLAMGIITTKDERYNIMWEAWNKARIKKKVKVKAIFSDTTTDYYKTFQEMKLTQIKVLKGITPTSIDVMGDRVLILAHGEQPSVLSIKNQEIVKSFTSFFYNLWNLAK